MSSLRVARLSLLTALFAVACGLPDSLHAVIAAVRVVFLES